MTTIKAFEDLVHVLEITELDCMSEQRLGEIYEMGYGSVEEWFDAVDVSKYQVPIFARGTSAHLKAMFGAQTIGANAFKARQ